MSCWICGTTEERDFKKRHCTFVCDDCIDTLDYHLNKAIEVLQKEHGTPLNELLEAFTEYALFKQDEYNEQLRKERMNQWQK